MLDEIWLPFIAANQIWASAHKTGETEADDNGRSEIFT